jgi:quercetin dioxygenase-like cupin family protein
MGPAALQPQRLTQAEIAQLPATGAGSGTSGVEGIRTHVLSGDPSNDGPYTIMLSVPANTRIAAHRHKDDRVSTIVSGMWNFGYGSVAGEENKALGPGSFYTEPAGVSHFARTGAEPVILYIHGNGPTDTQYTAASADPRR